MILMLHIWEVLWPNALQIWQNWLHFISIKRRSMHGKFTDLETIAFLERWLFNFINLKNKLVEMPMDCGFWTSESLAFFWIKVIDENLELPGMALNFLLLFLLTNLCNTGFSTTAFIKTKHKKFQQSLYLVSSIIFHSACFS